MKKLWLLAKNNIMKTKSVSIILGVLFLISALLLNAGLLVLINYGSHFDKLKEELSPSDAYYMMAKDLYTDEIQNYINQNKKIKTAQHEEAILLNPEIYSQGKDKSFSVLFLNMDKTRNLSKWKFIGEHEKPDEMAVYVPDVLKAVSGYNINDKIKLKYIDSVTKKEKKLEFVIKGYIEDIYFSSTDTGFLGFYLPEDVYSTVEKELNNDGYKMEITFVNVNDINDVSKMGSEMKEILNIDSTSLLSADTSVFLLSIDVGLIELSRCMIATMVSAMLVLFAIVIVIVCLLVIRFRIVNSIEDDVIKFGSLKSIGYTSKQIIQSIVIQFLIIASLSSIIGIFLSYYLLPYVSLIFEQQSGLRWIQNFDIQISSIVLTILLTVIVLITVFTAKRITKLNPIDALRGQINRNTYKKNHIKLEKSKINLSLTLALKSMIQNIKQNIMMVIIITSVTFSGTFGIIMYYNTSVDTKAFAEVPGMEICDVVVTLNTELDHSEIINYIKNREEVRKVQYFDEVKIEINDIQAVSYIMDDYKNKETNLVYKGHYPENKNEITLAGILAERLNKKVGDKVLVKANGKEVEFIVVGLSNGSQMGGINTSMRLDDYIEMNPNFKQQILDIHLKENVNTAKFIKLLENDLDSNVVLGILNFDKEMAEGMSSYQNIVRLMGIVMLAITLFVVTLVLYFMISTSIIRRKRELGIKKALGFTTLQLMNEISITFLIPIIIGVIIGSLLGSFYTNSLLSLSMKGMGVMKAMFIVNFNWIIIFSISVIMFSYLLTLLITFRIRKISAYELVTE